MSRLSEQKLNSHASHTHPAAPRLSGVERCSRPAGAIERSTPNEQPAVTDTMHPVRTSTIDHGQTGGSHRRSRDLTAILGLLVFVASGCVQEMSDQPRVDPYEPVAFFRNHVSVRRPVAGTIARGNLPEATALQTGREGGQPVDVLPVDITAELMQRGQKQFGIFCSHCHGPAGYGDGMVVQRGFPAPPSYHIDRLREATAGHFFTVITDGHGRMPAFGRRIEPLDRWAIIAYIRALQLSQNAPLNELPESDQDALNRLTSPENE